MLRGLLNTISLYQSSTTHNSMYIKIPITIEYYLPTHISSLQRDCPVLFSPLTSRTYFLYVFDTLNIAVTQNSLTTLAQYVDFNSNGFQRRYKKI